MKLKKIIIIPAYEPDEKLISLITKINMTDNVTTIVVNDGSSGKCKGIFDKIENKCILLVHEINKGKGCALKTAYKYIQKNIKEDAIIITMDADGQHRLEDAEKLYNYLSKNKNHLVLGKRLRGKTTPLRSKFGNTVTRRIYSLATKKDIYDTQTGLRAFTSNLLDLMIKIPGDRYEYEINVLLYCSKNNIKIEEIPIETIYIENNKSSHFHAVKDSIKIYKEIIKFISTDFISFSLEFISFLLMIYFFQKYNICNFLSAILGTIINTCLVRKYYLYNNATLKRDAAKNAILYIIVNVSIFGFLENENLNYIIIKILTIFLASIFITICDYLTEK